MSEGVTVVVDLGKTLSKISLWDRSGALIDRKVRSNRLVTTNSLRQLDVDGIGEWLVESLRAFAEHPVERIIPVGHGAGVVAIKNGKIAVPPLDYEQAIPDDVMHDYRCERDPFAQTGSPALPDGLNLGSQLFWLDRLYSGEMTSATLLPWAQYWTWFLTGRAVSELTSLGCHTDLWLPAQGRFSRLAQNHGWAERFATVVAAGDVVGNLLPSLAERTGLSSRVEVLAGLHDSNAALLAARGFPEISDNEATILSTGTWFVAMRLSNEPMLPSRLPEGRDCLINIDAFGRPIPSARFMGGREIEALIELDTRRVDINPDQPALVAAVQQVLEAGAMILPTLAPGCGPYPEGQFTFINRPEDWFARRTAACLYAAMVASASLDLIGSRDRILVEGRFAEAEVFVRALASLRPDCMIFTANAHNDVSFGALRLADPGLKPAGELHRVTPLSESIGSYHTNWLAAVSDSRKGVAA